MRYLGFILAEILLLLTASTGISAPALSSTEYSRLIHQAASDLERAASTGSRSQARQALQHIPEQAIVTQPDQPSLAVDNRAMLHELHAEIETGRTGIRNAAESFRNLQGAVSPRKHSATPSNAETALAKVLSRDEFRVDKGDGILMRIAQAASKLLTRVGKAIQRFLDRLFSWLRPREAGPVDLAWAGIAQIISYICVGILAFVLIWLIARAMRRHAVAEEVQSDEDIEEVEEIRPYRSWLAEAKAAMQAGNYSAALRAVYMASLMKLDEVGYVNYLDSRTDGGFVRSLQQGGRHDVASVLGGISRTFARVRYGGAPAGAGDCEAAWEGWTKLEGLTRP